MLDTVTPAPEAPTEPLDAYSAAVVGAVEQVGPAVVSVYVGGADEAEQARGGAGSGVVVTPDGYLLTNEHVVQRVAQARVTFVDGRSVPASVAGRDPATDLAGAWMLLPDDAREVFWDSYAPDDGAMVARSTGWAVLFGP